MTDNRDFKGVWIPKELWLNKDLTMLEKVIFVEIDSLDNESHCTAGNDYLAEFCNCSERKVSDAIKKLVSYGYIEIMSFDGRHRKIRVVNNSRQTSKNCEADSQNLLSNNIDNNIENNNISKDILLEENRQTSLSIENDFLGSRPVKKKSSSLYDKCYSEIVAFTTNIVLQYKLEEYLKLRLQMRDKPLRYSNQWKGLLNQLSSLTGDLDIMIAIVEQSTIKGWAAFYEIKSYKTNGSKDKFAEFGEVEPDKDRARKEKMSDAKF